MKLIGILLIILGIILVILAIVFIIYTSTPTNISTVKVNSTVKEGCANDLECPENTFCDVSRPGGMTPTGYQSGEISGSQKCISKCVVDSDCSSKLCKNYTIVGGDLMWQVKGCASN
jgi:hypothetical protein